MNIHESLKQKGYTRNPLVDNISNIELNIFKTTVGKDRIKVHGDGEYTHSYDLYDDTKNYSEPCIALNLIYWGIVIETLHKCGFNKN